jgi:type II secretion system protein L
MTRLVGIDLAPDEVRIARIERRLGGTRLVGCERLPAGSASALAAALESARAWRPSEVVAAFPIARTTHRVLVLPFRDRRRLDETVPLELLGQLPAEPGDVAVGHVTLGPCQEGTRVLAAVARRADVDELVAMLAAAGLPPTRIDLALAGAWPLLDDAPGGGAALVLADGSQSALVVGRTGRLSGMRALASAPGADPRAFAREVAWALTGLGGVPALVLAGADASVEVSDALAETTGLSPLAIDAAVRPPWRHPALGGCATALGVVAGRGLVLDEARDDVVIARRGRRVAALAAAAALLLAADLGVARWRLARRDAALLQAIHATAAGALPAGARIVAPRAQLEAAAGALARAPGTAASLLGLLRELSTRVPATVTVELDQLTVDGDVVRLHGRATSYETVDAFARALGGSPALRDVAAEESRAAVDGRGVEFGLRASWHAVAGAPS